MKDIPLSNCEKEFLLTCINNKQRIDARSAFNYRDIKISFGADYGCCQVQLGDTRVFAQASVELGLPRAARPKDGVLHVNVELSPMASPAFEAWRMSDEAVTMNRLLERCIKESVAIDTEALCVIAGEKVWIIRVYCTVLNHDGNILDCASIAAVTALSHFKLNEVTVDHKIITILSPDERNPIPLTIIHRPLCVTFAFFMKGKYMLLDPIEREERVSEGHVVVGMNKHREVCTLQVTGTMLLLQSQILRCVNMAAVKVKEINELIDRAIADDVVSRAKGLVSFCHKNDDITKHVLVPQDMDKVVATETVLDGGNEVEMNEIGNVINANLKAHQNACCMVTAEARTRSQSIRRLTGTGVLSLLMQVRLCHSMPTDYDSWTTPAIKDQQHHLPEYRKTGYSVTVTLWYIIKCEKLKIESADFLELHENEKILPTSIVTFSRFPPKPSYLCVLVKGSISMYPQLTQLDVNTWVPVPKELVISDDEMEDESTVTLPSTSAAAAQKNKDIVDISSGSEEETVTLHSLDGPHSTHTPHSTNSAHSTHSKHTGKSKGKPHSAGSTIHQNSAPSNAGKPGESKTNENTNTNTNTKKNRRKLTKARKKHRDARYCHNTETTQK